jgi:putative endonuclease
MNKKGYVYIVGDQARGPLYIGVACSLATRIMQHRDGRVSGLSKKHQLTRLVFFEHCESIHRAIWRARQIRYWKRHSKLMLITKMNPNWNDLYYQVSATAPSLGNY